MKDTRPPYFSGSNSSQAVRFESEGLHDSDVVIVVSCRFLPMTQVLNVLSLRTQSTQTDGLDVITGLYTSYVLAEIPSN